MYPYKREHYEFYRTQPRHIRNIPFAEVISVRTRDKVLAAVTSMLFAVYIVYTFVS